MGIKGWWMGLIWDLNGDLMGFMVIECDSYGWLRGPYMADSWDFMGS